VLQRPLGRQCALGLHGRACTRVCNAVPATTTTNKNRRGVRASRDARVKERRKYGLKKARTASCTTRLFSRIMCNEGNNAMPSKNGIDEVHVNLLGPILCHVHRKVGPLKQRQRSQEPGPAVFQVFVVLA